MFQRRGDRPGRLVKPPSHGTVTRVTLGNSSWRRASTVMLTPTDWGTAEPRLHCIPACKIELCPVQAGPSGGIIVSLTLHSDTEAQDAAPSRRSALRGAPQPAADFASVIESAEEPLAALIAPGWYADPVGGEQSRWWNGTAWTAELSGETAVESVADGVRGVVAEPIVLAEPVVLAEPTVLVEAAVKAPAAPLSRRQLRELVGPLTTAPALINATVETSLAPAPIGLLITSDPAPDAAPPPAAVPNDTDALSPFEALFESAPAERESTQPTAPSATAFLDSTDLSDSSVALPWIGAAGFASASVPAPAQPDPTGPPAVLVADPLEPLGIAVSTTPTAQPPAIAPFSALTSSRGALGFSLPPDPFAMMFAAVEATPQPFGSLSPAAVVPGPVSALSARSTTVAVWLFALLPIVHAAAVWLIFGLLDLGANPVIHYSVLAAPLFFYPVLAFVDGRELRGRGFSRTASAVFALIPPLYLLVRAIRVGKAGVVPLLLCLLLQTAAFSFVLVQLPAVFALGPLTAPGAATPAVVISSPITDAQRAAELTPSGMAAELTRQTLAKNLTFSSISCPPIPVTLDGTSVSCVGILASVKMKLIVVIDSTLPNSAFALMSEAPAV